MRHHVDLIQFDEPAFNVFMDDVKEWGVAALHKAIEGLSCKTAVHIRSGYGIEANNKWKETLGREWRQYEAIFPALSDRKLDQVSLECANSKVPLFLLELLKGKRLMVGATDVASSAVETSEQVAATSKAAAQYVDPERIYPCTNCGMAPLKRAVAVGKLTALGAGAELARKSVWQKGDDSNVAGTARSTAIRRIWSCDSLPTRAGRANFCGTVMRV